MLKSLHGYTPNTFYVFLKGVLSLGVFDQARTQKRLKNVGLVSSLISKMFPCKYKYIFIWLHLYI